MNRTQFRRGPGITLAAGVLALAFNSLASANVIDFEGVADGTSIDSLYSGLGVVFTNAVISTAGLSLNEAETPPFSGTNVAFDALGPIVLSFATPISSFSGYFTYATTLSLVGTFAGGTVATAASLFDTNLVSSGNPPNELLQLNFASGIDTVTITGDPNGGSFVMDDINFDVATGTPPTNTPEPGTFVLVTAAVLALGTGRLLRVRR